MSYKENVIMYWDLEKISDHNRDALDVSYDQIERNSRMVNGTRRGYVVAKKLKLRTSWSDFPSRSTSGGLQTIDGGLFGEDMLRFYKERNGKPFIVTLRDGAGNRQTYKMVLNEFAYTVSKRGQYTDFWDIDVDLEEV